MNKFNLFASAIFSLLLITSCGKDDEEVQVTKSDLIGTWDVTSYNVDNGVIKQSAFGITTTSTFTQTGKDYNATITFAEPDVASGSGSFNVDVKTTTAGTTETSTEVVEFTGFESFTVSGGNITFTDSDGEKTVFTVKSISSSKIELENSLATSADVFGISIETSGTAKMTLTK